MKKFQKKSAEELAKLSVEELAGYYNLENTATRTELESLIAEKSEDATNRINELKSSLNETMVKQMHSLNEALKAQGLAIQRIASKTDNSEKPLSFKQQIEKHLTEKQDSLETLSTGGKADAYQSGFRFDVKVPGPMTSANISGGNVPVEDRLPGFNMIPSRRVRFLDVLSDVATTSNIVSWVYQANKDGAAGPTGEGLVKNQIDFDLVVASESVKKFTAFIKVTTEMISDIPWIMGQIEGELTRELLKVVEAQAYEGDGTGLNMNGVRTVATAFAAGTFAATVPNANAIDALTVAMDQIAVAEQEEPTFIFMHPSDVTALKMIKVSATDRRYVDRLVNVASTLTLDGIPIIPTTLVTDDEALIGKFDLAMLVQREGLSIDIGLDGDDFSKNYRTILIEWRGLVAVKNNDRSAFVSLDFSTAITALETV